MATSNKKKTTSKKDVTKKNSKKTTTKTTEKVASKKIIKETKSVRKKTTETTPSPETVSEVLTPVVENIETVSTQEETGAFKLYCSTWKKMFSFKGRANRSEAFLFSFGTKFLFTITLFLFLLCGGIGSDLNSEAIFSSALIFYLLYLIATISLFVRRFHDFGKCGVFYAGITFLLACILLSSFNALLLESALITFSFYGSATLLFICFLCYFLKKGNSGENKYGPQPKTKRNIFFINCILFILSSIFSTFTVFMSATPKLQEEFAHYVKVKTGPSEEEIVNQSIEIEKFLNDENETEMAAPVAEPVKTPVEATVETETSDATNSTGEVNQETTDTVNSGPIEAEATTPVAESFVEETKKIEIKNPLLKK